MVDNELSISSSEFYERIDWLILLRWIAAAGVLCVILFTHFLINVELNLPPLFIGNIILVIYNLLFFLAKKNIIKDLPSQKLKKRISIFTNLQISLDLFMLSYLIYFSGGIINPFIFFFIFHMVMASILLSNRAAYIQGTFAAFLLACLLVSSITGAHPDYSKFLSSFPQNLIDNTMQLGTFIIIVSTLYITIYLTTTIENKLRLREKELEIANSKLEEKDKIKSQYIQTVSHDLKSSLAAIQSCLMVVLTDLTGEIPDKAREMISRAERRSRSLLDFVKELLNLSRIRIMSNNKLKKEKVDIIDAIIKQINIVQPIIDKKEIKLKTDFNVSNSNFNAIPDDLVHLFSNLISNAVKYTPQGGNINISLKNVDKNGNLEFSIEDSGIGIPQEELQHIFSDFYRAKNAQLFEKDGTGLGLAIVKQIIDRYKGEIWVNSEEGKGTKFIFVLPKENGIKEN